MDAFLKMQIPGLQPQTELLDLGWAPSESVFNMHPRWFSCKPTFKKHDFGGKNVFYSISAMAEEGNTSGVFLIKERTERHQELELTK